VTTGGQASHVMTKVSTDDKSGTGLTGLQVTTGGQVSQVMAQVSTDDEKRDRSHSSTGDNRGTGFTGNGTGVYR
jgi:hypothetical protein